MLWCVASHRDKRGAPGGVRDHNEFRIDAEKDKPALPDASLAAYKQHKSDERTGHKPNLLGTSSLFTDGSLLRLRPLSAIWV